MCRNVVRAGLLGAAVGLLLTTELPAAEPAPPPAPPALADPAPPTPPPFDLTATVRDLCSDDAAVRERADQALTAWVDRTGPAAEGPLKEYINEEDPRASAAIHAQRRRIDQFKEDAKLFAWYDGLGLPSVDGKPYGRIVDVRETAGRRNGGVLYGFLVAQTATEARLIHGWRVVTVPRTWPPNPAHAQEPTEPPKLPTFEPLDFAELAQEVTPHLQERMFNPFHSPLYSIEHSSPPVMEFLLARAAAYNHQFPASHIWVEQVREYGESGYREEIPFNLQAFLVEAVAGNLYELLLFDCNEPEPTRAELLAQCDFILQKFPDSKVVKPVQELADQLKIMMAEDEARAKHPPKPWAEMTPEEQIAELIFQLREVNGRQEMQPGRADIFDDWGGMNKKKEQWPTVQLAKLGYAAVPALIEHLDDRRLTRSVNLGETWQPYGVLRVGDCAEQILFRITARHFWTDAYSFSGPMAQTSAQTAKEKAQAWWAEVEKKGIDAMLIDEVQHHGRDATNCARQLLQRQPEKGLEVVLAALGTAAERTCAYEMLSQVAAIPGEKTTACLRDRLQDRDSQIRLLAIDSLWKRGLHAEALQAAREELLGTATALKNGIPDSSINYPTGFARVLLDSADPAEIACVAQLYKQFSAYVRRDVIFGVPAPRLPAAAAAGNPAAVESVDPAVAQRQAAADEAYDALLIAALDDDEPYDMYMDPHPALTPRLGDYAAHQLSLRWKLNPSFDYFGSRAAHRLAILKLKNLWREKQRQPALPLPVAPTIPTADPAQVTALQAALSAAADAKAVNSVLAQYEALGLSGLGPLQAALKTLPADHPAAAPGMETLVRLGAIVRQVELAPDSPPPPAVVMASFQALQDHPLTGEAIVTWICAYLREKSGACQLTIEHAGDGPGVTLRLRVTPVLLEGEYWRHPFMHVASTRAGGRTYNPTGTNRLPAARRAIFWNDTQGDIDRLLALPPDSFGEDQITLSWEE